MSRPPPRTPLAREERRATIAERLSLARAADHERRRNRVLLRMKDWGEGVTPCGPFPLRVLRALTVRGLVEVRFHLTRDGRAHIARLEAADQ